MVNIGLGFGSLLGITLALAGAGLYFLRTARPALARDHDIFFAAVALLCGCILLFQGWRLDPILLFGQFLLTGSSIFFAVENVRLRSATTAQAKRNVPPVDDERSVSRVYRAELDELTPPEAYPETRRIPGSRDQGHAYGEEEDIWGQRPTPTYGGNSRFSDRPSSKSRSSRSRSYSQGRGDEDYGSDLRPPVSRTHLHRSGRSTNAVGRSRRGRAPQIHPPSAHSSDYADYQAVDEESSDW